MNNISFIINGIELYTEKVLVELEIPLLFICNDKYHNRYTVLCVDSDEERYLVVRSDMTDIVDMIQNTITMRELFLKAIDDKAWMIKAGETLDNDSVEEILIQNIQDIDLPIDGAFYQVYNADIHDYVDVLLDRVPRSENREYVIITTAPFTRSFAKRLQKQKIAVDLLLKEDAVDERSFNKIIRN